MVKITTLPCREDGSIDLTAWITKVSSNRKPEQIDMIRHAFLLNQEHSAERKTFLEISLLQMGVEMADILNSLDLDHEALAAAILFPMVKEGLLPLSSIEEEVGTWVCKLVEGVEKMDAIRTLQNHSQSHSDHEHIDNLRKMLLAMVDDARVVLIKLAERALILRHLKHLDPKEQHFYAKETMDIYAPLANRLGVSEIKWELEDLSFRYLHPEEYKKIAKLIKTRRLDRQHYVDQIIIELQQILNDLEIENAEITGRAKHIYSIYRKMKRKDVGFEEIYDVIAVRILVPKIVDCYNTLSAIHSKWEQIPKEFDDYIAKPKPNGYRSIHTAVIGPANKNVEVQIRTYVMHQESELGVAAHWRYKEGGKQSQQAGKAAWLRQLLEWQKELASHQEITEELELQAFEDRVYVFTPNGDIIDLAPKSTPLDFAYHIHSEIGHRCRGAKINGQMVPLSYQLQTGDKVEILTTREAAPSRDWLNPHLGYIATSRSKSKIQQWFRRQDYEENYESGKEIVEREFKRLHIGSVNLKPYLERFNLKREDDLYAAIGNGDLKVGQLINLIQQTEHKIKKEKQLIPTKTSETKTKIASEDIQIQGVGNLLTHIAKCCKPIPGDPITGFITRGRGVTIHRDDCPNILNANIENENRLIEVSWGETPSSLYSVDIDILAYDRLNLIRDITTILANEKVNVVGMRSHSDPKVNTANIILSIEMKNKDALKGVLDKIQQLPNMIHAKRHFAAKSPSKKSSE